MTENTYGAMPTIDVGGRELPEAVRACLRSVTVESDALAPDSLRIVLDDPQRNILGTSGLDLGAELKLSAARTGEQVGEPLFEGTVYSLGFEYDERGAFTVVGAYDKSYALYTGLHTTTYQNVTDDDLARRLATEAGLTPGQIDSTPITHEHLSQVNETHWNFLSRRAREIDFTVRVRGKQLDFFQTADAGETAPEPGDHESRDRLQLVPGGNLEQLSARVTAAQQVSEVEVRGWDPRTKQELVATASARTRSASLPETPAGLAAAHGSPRHVTTRLPLSTQAECDAAAAAEAERLASSFAHVEGIAQGDPRLVAGAAVSVGATNGRLDGGLQLSRAKHVWNTKGYRTHFSVSGRQDRSLLGLAQGGRTQAEPARVPGVVVGIVTNLDDPDNAGRVQVKFPWLSGEYQSDWVRVAQLGAGAQRGLLMLPQVEDEVLLAFEQGDTRRPIVLGGLHNGSDPIPFDDAVGEGGTVRRRGFRTPTGHRLLFTDEEQGERTIEICTADDKVTITMDAQAGTLKIASDKDIEVASSSGNVTITAARDFTLKGSGTGLVRADGGLTLASSAKVSVASNMVSLGDPPPP